MQCCRFMVTLEAVSLDMLGLGLLILSVVLVVTLAVVANVKLSIQH